jgi:PAS domain S-box-containing protein/diguanylate cyclase (GGDEF)-like protein
VAAKNQRGRKNAPPTERATSLTAKHATAAIAPGEAGASPNAAQFRIITHDALDVIELFGEDGRIQYVNPAVTLLAGYRPEELIGRHYSEFVHPEDRDSVLAAFERALQTRDVVRTTVRYRHKDGSFRTIEVQGRNYLDEPGIQSVLVHTRDVTEHVNTERHLQEAEERYRSVISAMAEGVVLQDGNGKIVSCNKSAERILGLTADQMMGRTSVDPHWRAVRADGSPFAGEQHPAMVTLRTGAPQSDVTMGVHKPDGTLTWIAINTQPVLRQGVPYAVVSTFHDITQRLLADQALRKYADEIADLYNRAPCGYHSVDQDGTFVRINDTELEWLGYERDELVGKMRVSDLLTQGSLPLFQSEFPLFKARGWIRDVEVEFLRKDGSVLPVLLNATALKDAEGNYVMSRGTLYDITERRKSEQALRKVNRALRVLSQCNTVLVRAQAELKLLEDVCRVIVEAGSYRMAWVGYAEHDDAKTVRPVAQFGYEAGYLENAGSITWADTERGRGPTGTAIRTGISQINQNFMTNPRVALWRAEAAKRGFASSVALPLKDATGVLGALMVYAPEPGAFDTDEVSLLEELANDLVFGIATLRTREMHQRAEEAVRRLAYFDSLTGLPNRVQLVDRLEQAMVGEQPEKGTLVVMTFNVDRFSELQDGLGIRQADELLSKIAWRLNDVVADSGFLARSGVDIFAILLERADAEAARQLGQTILHAMTAPFDEAGVFIDVQASIGAAVYPEHGTNPDALLLQSNIAARQAKRMATGFALCSGAADQESPRRLALVGELRRAIQSDQLVLFYQPKVDMRDGSVTGVEALVRWKHPERGMIPPDEFIPLAEHSGLIKPLTDWVIDATMRQCIEWRDSGFRMPAAVNVSPINLRDPEFVDRFVALQKKWGIAPECLQIEMTETTLMEDPARSQDMLTRLRELGIRVIVDDFGTGYSSLSHIATLPVHALKIDRMFVMNMMEKAEHRSVVAAAITLAHSLGIRVVGEGAEARDQVKELARLGCDEIQGYFFSRPVPPDELRTWEANFSLDRMLDRA